MGALSKTYIGSRQVEHVGGDVSEWICTAAAARFFLRPNHHMFSEVPASGAMLAPNCAGVCCKCYTAVDPAAKCGSGIAGRHRKCRLLMQDVRRRDMYSGFFAALNDLETTKKILGEGKQPMNVSPV
jgi:hypothetical protein